MEARHLVLTWPIPEASQNDHAALMAAAQWLNIQFFADDTLKQQTGQTLAATDLVTPEGAFFCVSASLRPEAQSDEVRKRAQIHIGRLTADADVAGQVARFGTQLAFSLQQIPNPAQVLAQARANVTRAMLEGNLGLFFAMNVHRYGANREKLAKRLSSLSPTDIQKAAAKYLGEEGRTLCVIRPAAEAKAK